MDKKISVALATYKGGLYLKELLDSLAQQSYLPYELVVSDDNSPDDTIEILEAFAKNAPFNVRIIRNEKQLGVLDNFANAFAHTSGELIAYCDQDDIWDPRKLETCVKYFDNPEVKLVMHRSDVVDGKLNSLGYTVPGPTEMEPGETAFPSSPEMTYGLGHQMLFDATMYRDFSWIFRQGFDPLNSVAVNYDAQFPFLAGFHGSIISLEDLFVKFRRHESATSDAGLVDNKEVAASGFLGKSADAYIKVADEFFAIADVFQNHILEKMANHKERLTKYIAFLNARGDMYKARGGIYETRWFGARLSRFLTLIFSGAYTQKRKGGLGHKAFLVDAFVATFGLSLAKKIIALKS